MYNFPVLQDHPKSFKFTEIICLKILQKHYFYCETSLVELQHSKYGQDFRKPSFFILSKQTNPLSYSVLIPSPITGSKDAVSVLRQVSSTLTPVIYFLLEKISIKATQQNRPMQGSSVLRQCYDGMA